MPNPRVSIIFPVYNSEKYLSESLESIFNQTFSDFELIIINDNSTDNSLNIINSIKKKYSNFVIRIIHNNSNLGLTKSLNKAFKKSNGEFIARMDSDDIASSNRLEKQMNFLKRHPDVGLVGSNSVFVDKNKKKIAYTDHPLNDKDIRAHFFFHNPINHPSILFRKKLFQSSPYSPEYLTTQDYYLYFRLMSRTKLANIKDYLMIQRIHSDSISFRYKNTQLKNSLKIQEKYYLSTIKSKFENQKFFILNKYFLGDKNTFLKDKINIASACLEVLDLYKNIQSFAKNKSIEKFFLKKFIIHFFSSIGKKNSLNFLLKLFINFKLITILNIILFLLFNKLKKCVGY